MPDETGIIASLVGPVYRQDQPNEPISLGQVDFEFSIDGTVYREKAEAKLQFLPRGRLTLRIPTPGNNVPPGLAESLLRGSKPEGVQKVADSGTTFQAQVSHCGIDGATFIVNGPMTLTPPSTSISKAVCHLFNLPDFFADSDYCITRRTEHSKESRRCGRVILRAGGWEVMIAGTDRTKEMVEQLEIRGGYALTHMAKITREDGSTFSDTDLSNVLSCMHSFLSFSLGRWKGVGIIVGFDRAEKRVWEQWGLPLCARDAGGGVGCWIDSQNGHLLADMFPGFWRLWKDEQWHKPLTHAIHWYLRANATEELETALILSQVALELLAWTHCVQNKKIVSPEAFSARGLKAADKFRLLASVLSIPLAIPPQMKCLSHPQRKKWTDAMEAITKIRNDLVHPEVSVPARHDAILEARTLSLWFIEMVILRLCEYNGKYANRLNIPRWAGSVESVPWAVKQGVVAEV